MVVVFMQSKIGFPTLSSKLPLLMASIGHLLGRVGHALPLSFPYKYKVGYPYFNFKIFENRYAHTAQYKSKISHEPFL